MTISSAILALAPLLYWPLDDASGPAASDASGNGRPGVYGGNFVLRVPGVEPSTYAMQSNGANVGKVAPSYIASGQAATLMGWLAIAAVPSAVSTMLQNSSSTVGGSLTGQASGSSRGNLGITRNNIANSPSTFYVLDGNWHHYAITFSNTAVIIYVDGVNVFSVGAANAFTSAAAMSFNLLSGYMAHFAAWASTLSQANIQSVYNAPASIVQPAFTSIGDANQQAAVDLTTVLSDLTTVNAKLDQILAALYRTYV